ncbi:hypothetical protein TNIN_477451 [Trichonephila inaurata madagascariensis]|uniref:Uncharacterized protein n=1 Tax=Trichonephila inaurata madagascariensis TaxID=2747483 RepID=A0A8X6XWH6_9ARAC|nr:hypothetical protein TNIN_477451 [Trichonephila inaurata madagascariensis]
MATESDAGSIALRSSPQSDVNEEQPQNLNEIDETRESLRDTRNWDNYPPASNYRPTSALHNVYGVACANIPSATFSRPIIPYDYFLARPRSHFQNRWRELTERVETYASQIRDSNYFLYVLGLLMVLPTSDIVIGVKFLGQCHGLVGFLFLNGVLDFPIIGFRMYAIINRHSFSNCERKNVTSITWSLFWISVGFHIARMALTFGSSADPSSSMFCAPDFYTYNIYMSVVKACVLFIGVSLHIPSYI